MHVDVSLSLKSAYIYLLILLTYHNHPLLYMLMQSITWQRVI